MLTLLSSIAPRAVLAEAAALYEKRHSIRFFAHSAGGVDVAKRVNAGEEIDVVVLAREAIGKLVESGKLSADGRTDLMTSGIAVAVRSGSVHPDISDEVAVKTAVLSAASLSYSTGPSGTYLEKLFEQWGILAVVRDRITVPPPGVPVAHLLQAGHVDLGFQQLSELLNVPGIDVVGALPAPVQLLTTFTAAISVSCKDRIAAGDFLAFVASSATDAVKERHGMSPVRQP